MDISPASLDVFEKSLYDIHTNLKLFIKTLDDEKELLEKHDIEKLEQSLTVKQTVIDSMQTVSTECQHLLSNFNFPFNENGILQIISAFGAAKQQALTALWQEIKKLLKLGDQKNLVNGILITTLKNYNDALLQICNLKPQDTTYSNQNNPYNSPALSTREHKA